MAWEYDIYVKTGTKIPFPIIADRSGEIARKYGMISSAVSNTETVRSVYIIDDKLTIRAILTYPMTIGRNVSEILRVVRALQSVDANNLLAPANWVPGEVMIRKPPKTFEELEKRNIEIEKNKSGTSWYLAFEEPRNREYSSNNNVPVNNQIRKEEPLKQRQQPRTLQWKNFK